MLSFAQRPGHHTVRKKRSWFPLSSSRQRGAAFELKEKVHEVIYKLKQKVHIVFFKLKQKVHSGD